MTSIKMKIYRYLLIRDDKTELAMRWHAYAQMIGAGNMRTLMEPGKKRKSRKKSEHPIRLRKGKL